MLFSFFKISFHFEIPIFVEFFVGTIRLSRILVDLYNFPWLATIVILIVFVTTAREDKKHRNCQKNKIPFQMFHKGTPLFFLGLKILLVNAEDFLGFPFGEAVEPFCKGLQR